MNKSGKRKQENRKTGKQENKKAGKQNEIERTYFMKMYYIDELTF